MINLKNSFNIKKILMMLTIILCLTSFTFATDQGASVKLSLVNQNPDPVKSGDEVIVRISVENMGSEDLDDFYLEFIDSYPFSLFPDETREVFIGKIFANSASNQENAQIVKFKLKVDENIDEGNYPIKVRGYGKNQVEFEKEFLVEVNAEANAEISSISVDTLVPGQKTKISFGIKNVGKSDLENVKFSWESQDDIILPVGSGNFKYVDEIGVGEEHIVDFYVVSDLNTEPKLYKLDLTLEYDDVESLQQITDAGTIKNEKRREVQSKAGIYVGGQTEFDIAFKEIRNGESTFSITNIGSNLADSVVVKVVESKDWNVEGSKSTVVGKIKKGAYGRAKLKINPSFVGEKDLALSVEYTDTTGQRQQFNKTLSLSSDLFESSGLELNGTKEESTGINWKLYGGIGVVLVLLFVAYRMRRKSKKNRN